MSALASAGVLAYLPALVPASDNPSADFSTTTWWMTLIKILLIFIYLMLSVVIVIWFERRVVGFMQQRPGPNRFGPGGVFQTLADGFKLMWKEVIIPKRADRVIYLLAPIIAAASAFISFSIIPFGGTVTFGGQATPLQITDTQVSVLLALAVASLAGYGTLLAGWSSGSTYPLLGGLRSSAQVISYEIAMGLSLIAVFLYAGSMSTSQIVDQQRSMWYALPLCFSFFVFVLTMFGETNRLPFDLAEGEGEIVAGHHTEYSGMRFGMFFLGEYVHMFTAAGLATTVFLGGWHAPWGIAAIGNGMFDGGWWGFFWFTVKLWCFMFLFVWVRGTLPRTRYDQFMRFGWKFLIPVTLLWVMSVAFIRAATLGFFGTETVALAGRELPRATLMVIAALLVIVFVWFTVWDKRARQRQLVTAQLADYPDEIDPYAGGYPVPPMPGQRLKEPVRALGAAGATPSTRAATGAVHFSKENDRG